MATEPSKSPVSLFIGILYRTGVGVVIHTIRNTEALTFSSIPLKRIVRFSVNRSNLEYGKINPSGLNLIPVDSPLMIADIDTTRNGTIWQSIVRQRLRIDVVAARIDEDTVFITPRVRL